MASTLERVEWAGAALGLALVAGCWWWGSTSMAGGAALGALFASLNLRLLVWSWRGYIDAQVAQQRAEAGEDVPADAADISRVWPRFALKYALLLGGIGVLVLGVKAHMAGFLLGMGNVIAAAALSPLLQPKSGAKGDTLPVTANADDVNDANDLK